jgi:hypothetical protein
VTVAGGSWRVGETCIKGRGQCTFVRAGDKEGRIGDFLFLLSNRRDVMSAKRFFCQRIRPTIGFKRFDTATVTMRRMELAETEKIKCNLESLIGKHATAPETWCSVVGRRKPGRPFVRRIISSCYSYINVDQNRKEQLL